MGLGVSSVIYGLTIPGIQLSFHISATVVGSLATLFAIGRLTGSMLGGGTLARSGVQRTVFWGTVGIMVGLLAYGAAPAWWMLLVASFIIGYGFGSLDVVLNAAVVINHPQKHGLALSLLHACYGTGAFVGPFALAWLLDASWGWRSVPWAVGLLFALGVCGWIGIELGFRQLGTAKFQPGVSSVGDQASENGEVPPKVGQARVVSSAEAIKVSSLLRNQVFFLAGSIGFIYQGISWALSVWLPTLLLDVHNATAVEAAGGISALFIGITLGRLLNSFFGESVNLGYTRILFGGAVIACISLAGSLLAPTLVTTLVGVFLTGIGLSTMVPLALAVITAEWPHAVGMLSGVFATLSAAGIIFWPWALGALSDIWGFQAGLGAGVMVLFVLVVVTRKLDNFMRVRTWKMRSPGAS